MPSPLPLQSVVTVTLPWSGCGVLNNSSFTQEVSEVDAKMANAAMTAETV